MLGEQKKGFFSKLKDSLFKTKEIFTEKLKEISARRLSISESIYDEIFEVLVKADVGVNTSEIIKERLKERVLQARLKDTELVYGIVKEIILEMIDIKEIEKEKQRKLRVEIFVGVNGSGKTTTIAKYSNLLLKEGKTILLAGCDTYRAAAIEQLEIWAKRLGVEIVSQQNHADPSAVLYDAISSAFSKGKDYLLVDTAGRLHTSKNLMEELKKMKRVAQKRLEEEVDIILVVDANNGQNVLSQTKIFNDALDLTGIIITKLDGTAKGGIIIPICNEFKIPIKYIGIGEKIDELKRFNAREFVEALFE